MNKSKSTILSTFLKTSRKKVGLTQFEVAEILGYSTPQFISNWETGHSCPSLQIFPKIITLYKLNREEVIQILIEEKRI